MLLLVCVLATSNDWSLSRLGKHSWKRIQRWNYFVIALVAAHAIGYLVIEKQKLPFDSAVAVSVGVVLAAQTWGYFRHRHRRTEGDATLPRRSLYAD